MGTQSPDAALPRIFGAVPESIGYGIFFSQQGVSDTNRNRLFPNGRPRFSKITAVTAKDAGAKRIGKKVFSRTPQVLYRNFTEAYRWYRAEKNGTIF